MPGVSVEAELQPAGWRDGAMRLIVHVGRKPFGARLTLAEGSRTSAQALMAFDSQAQTRFAEQLSARVLLPPGDDEAHYYRLDYSQYRTPRAAGCCFRRPALQRAAHLCALG